MNIGNVDRLIALALEEDLGSSGDITSQALINEEEQSTGRFLIKEPLVLAGVQVAKKVFHFVDPQLEISFAAKEGSWLDCPQVIGTVKGKTRSILAGERTSLNFLQRLSGIATKSRQAAYILKDTPCCILDTRKTTPGWRTLEKAAVRLGGGANHRYGLFDGVLIKDNHIAAVGSISEAINRARQNVHHLLKIEVEVTNLAEVSEALQAEADIILLDNMDLRDMQKAVQMVAGKARIEASGGIEIDELKKIAEVGVDYISMGALTHSARAMDISLELVPPEKK